MGATGECAPPPQYNTAKPKTGGLSAHADDPGAKDLAARQRDTLPSKTALRLERRPSVPLDAPFCNSSEVGSKPTILIFCDVANGFLPPLKPAESFSFGFGGSLKTILSCCLGGCGGSNHKMRPITRERLAFEAGVSRFSFAARFQALLGLAPSGCIRKWRVIFALQMLRTPDMPLVEIAERVGYGPVNSFRVAFTKDVVLPPSRWRLRVKERKMSKERRDDR